MGRGALIIEWGGGKALKMSIIEKYYNWKLRIKQARENYKNGFYS